MRSFLAEAGESLPDHRWRTSDLALVALYYHPGLDRARAEWLAATAAEVTAGARPQPGVGGEVEYSFAGANGEPRWALALTSLFTLETGGKREARIAEAKARTLAAEAELREAAWRVAAAARGAVQEFQSAEAQVAAAGEELGALRLVEPLLQARYDQGAASTADLARLRAEIQEAVMEYTSLERDRQEAVARLAAALSLPLEELRGASIEEPSRLSCDGLEPLAPDSLQRLALAASWLLKGTLADYQVAEARLRLEIARQRPDIALGPGLFFDHGISKWTVAFGLPGLLLNRNRGPIAEAEAGRELAAAQVYEIQERVLSGVNSAVDRCRSTQAGLAAVDSLLAAVRNRSSLARAAFDRGESSRLDLALLEVEEERARRARITAKERRAAAGIDLETTLAAWLTDPPAQWPDPTRSPRRDAGAGR